MTWKTGDIALCVIGGNRGGDDIPGGYPIAGSLHTVAGVGRDRFKTVAGLLDKTSLSLPTAPPNIQRGHIWPADRFVRVTPGSEITGIEVEKTVPARYREEVV